MEEHSSLLESQINGAGGNGSLDIKRKESTLTSEVLGQACGSVNLGSGEGSDAAGNEIGPVKRGRGRPRKDEVGMMKLGANLPHPAGISPASANSVKRPRGRPKGSGKLQLLAASGRFGGETEANFTPHVIHVHSEEDLFDKITSFARRGPHSICILSATGLVSSVVICHLDSLQKLRYEGCFEIITLNGSFVEGTMGDPQSGMLTISLAKPDGNVFGGTVAGPIIAACPIQLVVASFTAVKSKYAAIPSPVPCNFVSPDVANGPVYFPKMIDAEEMCNTAASAPPGFIMKPDNFMIQNQNFNYGNLQNVDSRTLLSQTQQSMEDELMSQHPNNGIP